MHQERFEEVFLVEFLKEGSQGIKCEIGLKMVLYKGFFKSSFCRTSHMVPKEDFPLGPKGSFHRRSQ